jgi:hypothetical protein
VIGGQCTGRGELCDRIGEINQIDRIDRIDRISVRVRIDVHRWDRLVDRAKDRRPLSGVCAGRSPGVTLIRPRG